MPECLDTRTGVDDTDAVLACWLPHGHSGPHYDEADNLTWFEGKPFEWPADEPPDYDHEEAERAGEHAAAQRELAAIEAAEARDG